MTTISQVFQSKGLWQWFSSAVQMAFNGTTEKGQDYASVFGTPVGVPVGGIVMRTTANANSINDVVELQDSSGAVWLYQHISSVVKVGDVLSCGSVIGTQNGLPVDQYSTGSHIEVRYCLPGTWSESIVSWNEPWINPSTIFANLANQQAGSVASGTPAPFWQFPKALNFSQLPIAPDASVAAFFAGLDVALELQNPFDIQYPQIDTIGIGPLSTSFADPVAWAQQVGSNFVNDLSALAFRTLFVLVGLAIIVAIGQQVTAQSSQDATNSVGGSSGIMQIVGALA